MQKPTITSFFDISPFMIKDTDMMTPKVALQLITNISRMTAYRYIKQVRVHLGKSSEQIVTVKEFRTYYGI